MASRGDVGVVGIVVDDGEPSGHGGEAWRGRDSWWRHSRALGRRQDLLKLPDLGFEGVSWERGEKFGWMGWLLA